MHKLGVNRGSGLILALAPGGLMVPSGLAAYAVWSFGSGADSEADGWYILYAALVVIAIEGAILPKAWKLRQETAGVVAVWLSGVSIILVIAAIFWTLRI